MTKYGMATDLPEVRAVLGVLARAACTRLEVRVVQALADTSIAAKKQKKIDKYCLEFTKDTLLDAGSHLHGAVAALVNTLSS